MSTTETTSYVPDLDVEESTPAPVASTQEPEDDVISIDLNHLTIDEIDVIEDIIDAPIDSMSNPNVRKGKLLRAVGYVVKRRDNPDFRLEDAGKLRVDFGQAMEADPTVSDGS